MATNDQNQNQGFSHRLRFSLLMAACGLAILVVVAGCLKPSPYQHGTHQQLGLPPCSFYLLFGIPCPTCGCTTAWAHLLHGELLGALRANCGGTVLAVLAVASVPWLMISAVFNRWVCWTPDGKIAGYGSMIILGIMLVQWMFRLLAG